MFKKFRPSSAATSRKGANAQQRARIFRPGLEQLEDRCLPSTFTVLNTNDSGADSLRQAILNANSTANVGGLPDRIEFNIAGAGVHTITPGATNGVSTGLGTLPGILDPVIIDGYTQPGASPNTLAIGDDALLLIELNGANVDGIGLAIGSVGSTVRGLVINRFGGDGIELGIAFVGIGSDNHIEGNFIGTDPTGTIARGNRGSGINMSPNNNSGNTIGGTTPAARNLISGNSFGILFGGADFAESDRNVIQGNYIGTNAAGTAALGNQNSGIALSGGVGNTIGGTIPGAGNLISGNGGAGVVIATVSARLPPNGNVIQGNFIGTDAAGTAPLGNGEGGVIFGGLNPPTFGNTIGGLVAGAGNLIAFNGHFGIGVFGGTGNAILSNLIHSNSGRGIAFNSDVIPTPNDPGDGDVGVNNFPVLTAVTTTATATSIQATLNSTPGKDFRIEYFASAAPDASSFGEGQTFLGFKNVTTDGSGNVTFTADTAADGLLPLPAGQAFVTATATNTATNDTSEFSEVRADLGLTMSASATAVFVGQQITYTLVLTNTGPFPAVNVSIQDTLPGNNTFVAATTVQGDFSVAAQVVTFHVGTLAVGASITATIVVRANAAGNLANTATTTTEVRNAQGGRVSIVNDPDLENNTRSATTRIDPAPATDLKIEKTAISPTVTAGQELSYTLTVSNISEQAAIDVTLNDALPASTTFVSFTAPAGWTAQTPAVGATGSVQATADSLASGQTATFQLIVRVAAEAADGSIINNTAQIATDSPDINPSNNSATASATVNAIVIPPSADVQVETSAAVTTVNAGADVAYTLVVTNLGGDGAANVALHDTLPANTTFVSFTAPTGWTVQTPAVGAAGQVIATFANLGSGQSAAFELVVHVQPDALAAALADSADVAAFTTDPNAVNNSSTATLAVTRPAAVPPTAVQQNWLTITLVGRSAAFHNELGFFLVDDASGRIGKLHPRDRGYAAAALARRHVLFHRLARVGTVHTIRLPASSFFELYLVQNGASADAPGADRGNHRVRGPVVFFANPRANGDGFNHARWQSAHVLAFEDQTGGGDRDFNDLVVRLRIRGNSTLRRR